ncbi:interferon-induced protein 44-like, partial [Clarias magur]
MLGTFTTFILTKNSSLLSFPFASNREKHEIEQKLRNFKINNQNVPYVRLLLVGEVGVGKSSFVNSVNNAFQGRITCEALTATGSERSFTKT